MEKRRGGMRRRKVCQFCVQKAQNGAANIDYKDVDTLKKYITEEVRFSRRESREPVRFIREK